MLLIVEADQNTRVVFGMGPFDDHFPRSVNFFLLLLNWCHTCASITTVAPAVRQDCPAGQIGRSGNAELWAEAAQGSCESGLALFLEG
jgi:hypothetical protein